MEITRETITTPFRDTIVYYSFLDMKVILINIRELLITTTDWFRWECVNKIQDIFLDTEFKAYYVMNSLHDNDNTNFEKKSVIEQMFKDVARMKMSLNKNKYLTYFKCTACKTLDCAVYIPWFDETDMSLYLEKNCIEMSELCCCCYLKRQS
jgi:hypothetical protein